MTSVLARFTKPLCQVKDEDQTSKEIVNIGKSRRRYYILQWEVIIFIHVFLIPNGDGNIRMVYNGNPSGLNDDLCDPHCTLPTFRNNLRAI